MTCILNKFIMPPGKDVLCIISNNNESAMSFYTSEFSSEIIAKHL